MSAARIEIVWRLPGEKEEDATPGVPEAAQVKAVGGYVNVGKDYSIHYENRWGDDRFPWKLSRRRVVGSRDAIGSWEQFEEEHSFRAALTAARKLARAAIARAEGRES